MVRKGLKQWQPGPDSSERGVCGNQGKGRVLTGASSFSLLSINPSAANAGLGRAIHEVE
jgi:hypothetical protein